AMRRRACTVANAKDGGYRENDSWTPPLTLVPQAGQKTARSGRCSPQRGQLGTGDAFMRGALCPQLQSPKRLRCTPAQRADELRVVLVGDLSGAMVELQLLQRGQSAISPPPRKTSPANQIRFTSGFTKTLNSMLPSLLIWSATTSTSPALFQSW